MASATASRKLLETEPLASCGALAKKDRSHVPYRDSRLTFLLRPSLCGDAKCLAIFNLAPEKAHLRESLSTLRFGQKVTKCAPSQKCAKCGHQLK